MPTVQISRNDWSELLIAVNEKAGVDIPVWKAMTTYYEICHESIISPLSSTLLFIYSKISGTKQETYESLNRLPFKYLDACSIIDDEINRIESYKNGNS